MNRTINRYILTLFAAFVLIQCVQEEQQVFEPDTRLLLTNPGLWDLKAILFLMEQNIISLDKTELLVIYYDSYKDDYQRCVDYANEHKLAFIKFKKVLGDLNPENLFKQNNCSAEFYNLFKHSDGILFFGGADFPPETYDQKTSLLTAIVTPQRHYFELSFLFHLLGGSQNINHKAYLEEKPDYIIYGFCLGMQTMNAATGGTMFQDIPKYIYQQEYVEDVLTADHDQMHFNYWTKISNADNLYRRNLHPIKLAQDGYFSRKMNVNSEFQPLVCSNHHQAVDKTGLGLQIAALSTDGKVVEAMSHEKYENVLGVQFHPEIPTLYQKDGPEFIFSPGDSMGFREYDKLSASNSLDFHLNFWQYFSNLFQN